MLFFQTERLVLRSYEERDVGALVQMLNDWDVVKWMGHVPFPYTRAVGLDWLEKMKACEAAERPEYFVLEKRADGAVCGAIGVRPAPVEWEGRPRHEVFYWLGRPHWGAGLMAEALAAVLPWIVRQSWIESVVATTNPLNERSQRLLKKLGFVYQGFLKQGERGDETSLWLYPKAAP